MASEADYSMIQLLSDEIAALTLQLSEVDIFKQNQKGKQAAHLITDPDAASDTFHIEVSSQLARLQDRQLAYSIAGAVSRDGNLIGDLLSREIQAHQDRQVALLLVDEDKDVEGLQDLQAPPPYTEYTAGSSSAAQAREASRENKQSTSAWKLPLLNIEETCGPASTDLDQQAKVLAEFRNKNWQCCTCLENYRPVDVSQLACGDIYCNECLKALFIRAAKDKGLYPPRCCRQLIPFELVRKSLSKSEVKMIELAAVEFSVTNRTYCSNANCSHFIMPKDITADHARCDECGTETCVLCKNGFHEEECAADTALQATLSLAGEQGWKRCPRCRAIVELDTGCHHITCKCGAEWCYLCTSAWKTCTCDAWEERNLVVRAEEIIDREAIRPLPVAERRQRVLQMQAELREVHECEHSGTFERVLNYGRRRLRCELCHDRHWKYILQCRHCHLRVCEDCRRHRI